MDKFSQPSVSSDVMRLVYKYDKPIKEVLSDLDKLNEDSECLSPIAVLEDYYNEQKRR